MNKHFYFERLEVWINSKNLAVQIYLLTEKFPSKEQFGLTSQIRRSTISISANIAEGISRKTNNDKARFINQSFSSAIELLNYLIIIKDLQWISYDEYENFRNQIELITNQLNALYNKIKKG